MVDAWIKKILQNGLSRHTLLHTHWLIYSAFNYAVQPAQLIHSNPSLHIKIPKNAPLNVIKRTIITPEQFAALIEKYPFDTESSNRYIIVDDLLLGELKRWQSRQAVNEKTFGDSYIYAYRES